MTPQKPAGQERLEPRSDDFTPEPAQDVSDVVPPLYEVEEQLVERRLNPDGKFVQIVDGKEIAIERRRRTQA